MVLVLVLAGCSVAININTGGSPSAAPAAGDPATPPAIPPESSAAECTTTLSKSDNLQTALDAAKQRDVLCLSGGTYKLENTLLIHVSGENDHPITLRSAPGQHAIIDGPDGDPPSNWSTPTGGL